MFKIIGSTDGGGVTVRNDLMLKDAEALVDGALYVVTTGRLTIAGATVKPQYLGKTAITAGTSVKAEVEVIRNNLIFAADYTSTDLVVGTKVYAADATGLLVNGAAATGGKIEILTVDTVNKKCTCKYND